MTKAEETFLVILKDAIHPDSEQSELSSQDWASILKVAGKQNLFLLVFLGNGRDRINDSMTTGKRRIELLKKYEIL